MEEKFRIKEVCLPYKGKDICYFFPQVFTEVEEKTGWLFKKTNKVTKWCNFYEGAGDWIYTTPSTGSYSSRTLCQKTKKEDAENIIDLYQKRQEQMNKSLIKFMAAHVTDDAENVKFLEVV